MSAAVPDSPDQALVERVVRSVTDLWDEPLDEVHDIPPIVNAIMAEVVAPLLEDQEGLRLALADAWDERDEARARAAEDRAAVERCRSLLALWMAWDGGDEGFGTSPQVRAALAAALAGDEVTWEGRNRKLHRAALSRPEETPRHDTTVITEPRRLGIDTCTYGWVCHTCAPGTGVGGHGYPTEDAARAAAEEHA